MNSTYERMMMMVVKREREKEGLKRRISNMKTESADNMHEKGREFC
jgi:hypothetical protein